MKMMRWMLWCVGQRADLYCCICPPTAPGSTPMLWRHFRREVTHCELFESLEALVSAAQDFFDHYNLCPDQILSIIGAIPKNLSVCT